ncbi:MAG: hypothetical protein HGA81_01175 [Chlorobium limicola]|nr:hypothetical protein [Chlorobium limicola]
MKIAHGKIVVAGSGDLVARINADGSYDTSFGSFGSVAGTLCGGTNSVAVLSNGKIVAVGGGGSANDIVIGRCNMDGSIDTSFDGDGIILTDIDGRGDQANSMAIQSDGKIVVAGTSTAAGGYAAANPDFCVVRYNTDGSLDTSFDGDGKLTTEIGDILYPTDSHLNRNDYGKSVALQSDGKIVVAGSSSFVQDGGIAVVRYNLEGSLDTSFSGDGKLITQFGVGSSWRNSVANSVTVQSDGKIVVAGDVNNDIVVARYNTDGSMDTSFSGDGIVITDLGQIESARNVTVQSDGKIVVVGSSSRSDNVDFLMLRYNSDGSLDTSFSGVSDTTAPTVSAFSPLDGATGAAIGSDIVVTFSEAIQKGTGTIAIHSGSADGPVMESYDAATSTNLTISGSALTINPTASLSNSTHYYVTFSEGSVKDLAENNYAGSTSYDFTTEDPALTPVIHNGISVMPEYYTGPATAAGGAPIHFQYLGDNTGEVLIGTANNDFINIGGGVDAVNAGDGNDVIDGGTGSNFLTGGSGTDIFFSDGRSGETTWSTITDWEEGEQLSVWGWQPGMSRILQWVQAGAPGYEGLTMHADLNGDNVIDTSVTFTGIASQSQLPTPLEFDGVLWFV